MYPLPVLSGWPGDHPSRQCRNLNSPEGSLLTERASDGQVPFYTRLQLPTKNGIKWMTIKTNPGAQVNTIPLSSTGNISPKKLIRPGILSQIPSALQPTPGFHMMANLSPP